MPEEANEIQRTRRAALSQEVNHQHQCVAGTRGKTMDLDGQTIDCRAPMSTEIALITGPATNGDLSPEGMLSLERAVY